MVQSKLAQPLSILIGLIVLGIMSFFAWKILPTFLAPKQAVHEAESGPVELNCVSVVRRTLHRVDQLPGEIQAYQDVAIFPKVPGFIDWIGIDRGTVVKKGQLMVRMYAPEYLAQRNESLSKVEESRARLMQAESKLVSDKAQLKEAVASLNGHDSTYQRLKAASLTPGVVASNDVVLLAQTVEADRQRVNSWQNRVQATTKEVDALGNALRASQRSADNYKDFASYLEIPAPFDGYITERNLHKGSFIGPLGNGAYPAIAKVAQLNLLRIVVPVPERDTSGILPGCQVSFSVSNHPDRRFQGTVARIGNYLDKATRTMPVELNFWNPKYEVFPGAFCKVYWPTRRQLPTLFVPLSSVVSTTLDNHVCVVRDGKVVFCPVRKGQTMNNLVEVFGELSESEIVVLRASEELGEGTLVRPKLVTKEVSETEPKPRPSYHAYPTAPPK